MAEEETLSFEEIEKLLQEDPDKAARLLRKASRKAKRLLAIANEARKRKLTSRSRPIGRLAKEIQELAKEHHMVPERILALIDERLKEQPVTRTRRSSKKKEAETA